MSVDEMLGMMKVEIARLPSSSVFRFIYIPHAIFQGPIDSTLAQRRLIVSDVKERSVKEWHCSSLGTNCLLARRWLYLVAYSDQVMAADVLPASSLYIHYLSKT